MQHAPRACEDAGYAPNVVYETDNFSATVGMVAADLGIALVPRLALGTTLLPPNVVVKKLAIEITRTISVVVPTDKRSLPAVAALSDAIASIDGMIWRIRSAQDRPERTHNARRRTHDERRYDVTPG
jgi:DNA-binding transcriptional LysR family regulator